jgi:hypothetical protein
MVGLIGESYLSKVKRTDDAGKIYYYGLNAVFNSHSLYYKNGKRVDCGLRINAGNTF